MFQPLGGVTKQFSKGRFDHMHFNLHSALNQQPLAQPAGLRSTNFSSSFSLMQIQASIVTDLGRLVELKVVSGITEGRAGNVYSPIPFLGRSYLLLQNAQIRTNANGVLISDDMRALDSKVDDGLPLTGHMFVISSNLWNSATQSNNPAFSTPYNTNTYPSGNTVVNQIFVMKAGF